MFKEIDYFTTSRKLFTWFTFSYKWQSRFKQNSFEIFNSTSERSKLLLKLKLSSVKFLNLKAFSSRI